MIRSKHYPPVLCSMVSVAAVASVLLSGCGKAEPNPTITLAFGSFTAKNSLMEFLIPSAYAALSNGKLCFKRLRFKTEGESTSSDPTSDSDNIDFSPGEVSISTTGTTIGEVTVPAGTYKRVEFDLEKDCPGSTSGYSVQLTNSNGTFNSEDRVTVKFEGTFEAAESGQRLELGAQAIIDALNAVTTIAEVKSRLEAAGVKGTF
jgi:hypothetical protein